MRKKGVVTGWPRTRRWSRGKGEKERRCYWLAPHKEMVKRERWERKALLLAGPAQGDGQEGKVIKKGVVTGWPHTRRWSRRNGEKERRCYWLAPHKEMVKRER